ncbi:U3 small nucleolar RNA-associated protein 18 [Histomonas meleagridis]|uniref:U3 small nucleolar RNA-associated protein 18-like n=1 Tax=Histomonas meleagridis TaxID=135588 RepID=UPI003559BF88|nr:U3 small nucleolar RNA-associated protein 18 [Histomonas meleagridis]KAH0797983.1 U3 small nucleolar RNA-associated protein 18-like [Histomonas meleagridis]
MSLESIVFGTKHFTDNQKQKAPEAPIKKAPAWVDPDDLSLISKPNEDSLQEKYLKTVQHADVSWSTKESNPKEVVDAVDLFSESPDRIPSDNLLIERVADLYTPSTRSSVLGLVFNPCEPLAALLDSRGIVHVISVNGKNNKVQYSIPFPKQAQRHCLCYSSGGELIFVGCSKGTFHTIDCRTQTSLLTKIPSSQENITAAYCSPNNKLLVLIAQNRVHFIETSNRILLKTVPTSDELHCGTFDDTGDFFIAAGQSGHGIIFDCATFTAINRFQEPEMQFIHAIAFSHNRVAIGTDAGVLHVFDFQSLKERHPRPLFTKLNLSTKVDTVKFNPTGELIVFASSAKNNSLRILHLASQKVFSNWPTQKAPLSEVKDAAFDATGQYLAIGNEKGKATMWELSFYKK